MTAGRWEKHVGRLLAAHALPDAETAPLVAVLGRCQERRISTGEVLCRQGEPASEIFFLLEGRVSVLKEDQRSREREIGTWFAPAVIGAPAVVEGGRRSATCVAGAPGSMAVLDGATARVLLREASLEGAHFRWLLLANMTEALAGVRERVRAASTDAVGAPPPGLDELHALFERTRPSGG